MLLYAASPLVNGTGNAAEPWLGYPEMILTDGKKQRIFAAQLLIRISLYLKKIEHD